MKKDVIKIIKIVGINFNEIFIDIDTGNGIVFNSIEYREPNDVLLHIITEDIDIETYWEDLTMAQRKRVIKIIIPSYIILIYRHKLSKSWLDRLKFHSLNLYFFRLKIERVRSSSHL